MSFCPVSCAAARSCHGCTVLIDASVGDLEGWHHTEAITAYWAMRAHAYHRCWQRAMHCNDCGNGAGVSAKLQHYRLTAVVGPSERDLTCLTRLLAGRAASSSILSGSARTVLGDSFLGCRSTVGYATAVSPLMH